MIYMKVLIPPLSNELLVVTNRLIDFVEEKFPVVWTNWNPSKTTIRIKSKDKDELIEIEEYMRANFTNIRWYVYNEEEKTETIIHIEDAFMKGEYILPLFPEDYKF